MPHEIKQDEFKVIVKDILSHIAKVCRDNDITYYLAYGSLLGAVRHKGFIPWDDDIDIVMDRQNFEKFKRTVRENDHEYYKLRWISEDEKYDLPLPKVIDARTELRQAGRKSDVRIGAWVDILIIDDVPDDAGARKKVLDRFDFYEQCWTWSQYTSCSVFKAKNVKSFVKSVILRVLSLPGSRFWSERLYSKAEKYNNNGYGYFSALTFSGGKRKAYKKEWLGKGCEVLFEGESFNAPENWHEYLKNAYGDYMQLPPENKRISNHNFTVYFKDN